MYCPGESHIRTNEVSAPSHLHDVQDNSGLMDTNTSASVSAPSVNLQSTIDLEATAETSGLLGDDAMQERPRPERHPVQHSPFQTQLLGASNSNLSIYAVDAHAHIISAAKPTRDCLCQSFSHTMRKVVEFFETCLLTRRLADGLKRKPPKLFHEGNDMVREDLVPCAYSLTRERLKDLDSSPLNTEQTLKSQLWGMIPSHRVGTKSVWSDTEDGYQYTVNVRLKDKDKTWILQALVDTGAERSFVSRGALSKIGRDHFKERPLPKGRVILFTGPFGDTTTQPLFHIDVELDFEGVVLERMRAKLRIVEDTDKFDIILGGDFIKKYREKTKTSLVDLIEQASQPNLRSTNSNRAFALRSVKKSPVQVAGDNEHKKRTARAYEAIYKSLPNATSTESARLQANDHKQENTRLMTAIHRNADSQLSTREKVPAEDDINDLDWQSRRTVGTETSSTQWTQYSLGKPNTSSSISSANSSPLSGAKSSGLLGSS